MNDHAMQSVWPDFAIFLFHGPRMMYMMVAVAVAVAVAGRVLV